MKRLKIFIYLIIAVFIIGGIAGYKMYKNINYPNIFIKDKDTEYLYIPTGASFDDLKNILYENEYLKDKESFEWVAERKNLKNHVYPGRYLIKNKMSNNELIDMLRSGKQDFVKLIFNNVRTKEELASKISQQIEADSISIINLLNDNEFIAEYGFKLNTIINIFIPNTYEFYWNTSAEAFISKMFNEYEKFWNKKRLKKAEKIGLNQLEIITLASIVEEETKKDNEKERLAGVYINRLNKGMRLQADPTVVYAIGNFSINRVLKKHLQIDSPYNTYRYKGLPPGPITIPSIESINAVLNYEHHKYLYFCAREDFSGYHNFAKTLKQHNINAKNYQKALNKKRILK
ncbi:MAG: endolytic transglycosylase MltG [Bacteroidales bacterium]|nr:endolytic transglycosylase MltG [Bacteroidales bacterium]